MKDMGTMDKKTYSFSEMPTPAEATSPRELTMLVMMRKEMVVKKSCRAMGVPSRRMRPTARGTSLWRPRTEKGRGCRRM